MALVWEKKSGNQHYRVTKAGASVRLYTDGVFHSQYNPRQPVGGNLWDLLFLPAFMHPEPRALERVLVLGVGGGAVLQQLDYFLQPKQIVGVDLDPVHLQVARRFFGVTQKHISLVHAEARSWLRAYDREPFDLIIEDLFLGQLGSDGAVEPVRAIAAHADWFELLSSRLNDKGVLVMNFECRRSLAQSAYKMLVGKTKAFAAGYHFGCASYENAIAAFLRKPLSRGHFLKNTKQFRGLDWTQKSCRLQFHYRKLPTQVHQL